MGTKKRKSRMKRTKSRKPRKTKSRRRKRRKSKKKKNRMMKTKTKSRTSLGGGGGSTNYCNNCTSLINEYKLMNKSAEYMSDVIPYSKLSRGKNNCKECLTLFAKNKKRLDKKGIQTFENSMRTILPVAEKMKKAMSIQRKETKNNPMLMPDTMYDDMVESRLKGLKKYRIGKRKNKINIRRPAPNISGYTPLIEYTMESSVIGVRSLLNRGANPNSKDDSGNTAMMLASERGGGLPIVRLLLEYGANPNIKNHIGNTALMLASQDGLTEMVRILLEGGANPKLKNNDGDTALSGAIFFGHSGEIIDLLKDRRYSMNKRKYKIDGIPAYEEIQDTPPQYYAPELERVMNRNNMLDNLLERTQKNCTDEIAQLKYDKEVLEQRLEYVMYQQQPNYQQERSVYMSDDDDDDVRRNTQSDIDNLIQVRTRLFEESNWDDNRGADMSDGDDLDDLESRLGAPSITIRHNIGSFDNLDIYDIDTPKFQDFLGPVERRSMNRRTLESIINYIGMSESLSNVSRCVKIVMIYCLEQIHQFYNYYAAESINDPDVYLSRMWLTRGENPSMELLKELCLEAVEKIVNDIEFEMIINPGVVVEGDPPYEMEGIRINYDEIDFMCEV